MATKLIKMEQSLKALLEELNDQANELISYGNSKEIAQGKGMQSVIEAVSELLK